MSNGLPHIFHRQIVGNPACVSRSPRSTGLHRIDHLQNQVFGFGEVTIDAKKETILSPEVFDILNKLMKSDKDNATGNIQMLCKKATRQHGCRVLSVKCRRMIWSSDNISGFLA